MMEKFLQALIVHIIGDWFLQSDWMAKNKVHLDHPAAWIHSGFHALGLLLIFDPSVALLLGLSHLLIDTRIPLEWLRKPLGQHPTGPEGQTFVVLQDQAAHVVLIALATLLVS